MLKKLFIIISSDLYRYTGRKFNIISFLRTYFSKSAFRYILIYRIANYCDNIILKFFFRLCLLNLSIKYGYQLNANVSIGKGLYIGHRGSVVVNGEAIIGDNVNLAHGITIGYEPRGERKGAPTIGNKVWIGTNAVIVGKITIGDNVLIAPNTFINKDIPANSIVIGSPAKIIFDINATDGYLQNLILEWKIILSVIFLYVC